jgi:hypothetical protein
MIDHSNENAKYMQTLHRCGFTAHIRTEDGAENFYCEYSSYGSEGSCLGRKCREWVAMGTWQGAAIGTCGYDIEVIDPDNPPEPIPF